MGFETIKQYLENVSITKKLMSVLVIMTLLVMVSFGVVNYLLFVNQLNEDLDIRLEEDTKKLEEDLALHLWNLDYASVEKVSNKHVFVKSFSLLRIINDFNELMYEVDNLEEGKGYAFKKMVIFYEGEKVGFVEIAISTNQIEVTKNAIIHSTFVIILAVSLSVTLVSFLISRSISRPIIYLKESAEKITSGNLDSAIKVKGSLEIVKLSESMEQMRQSVKKSIKVEKDLDIAQHKIDLDKKLAKEKDEFSSMITHELKTPLTPIRGYCEMLIDQDAFGSLTENQIFYIKKIDSNAALLVRLIGDILDAQKIGLKRMTFNKKNSDVGEFLDKIKQDCAYLMKDKEIEFRVINSVKTTLKTDPQRLRQVFDNVIRNAVDFVPSTNGKIEIASKQENGKIIFHVKDNGIGITKDKQKNIFQKFYQVDTSFTRKHGGTGLGLVISKGIVNALGGEMWFESKEGKGSTFYFSIPLR